MKKYYRVQSNIDLDAIYDNIKNIRSNINKDTMIMAILKLMVMDMELLQYLRLLTS